MLGNAGEPLGLGADVPHKVPDHLRVHLPGLQNGVGQQTDGGQRRLQLMAGVGDEAAANFLGGLEAVGELVELPGQLGQLVPAHRLEAVAVLPLAHDADGPEEGGDAGGEHF